MGKYDLTLMDQASFPDLIGYVANGGSLIDFVKEKNMEYNKVAMWIYDINFPDRQRAYEGSLMARSEYVVQAILKELHGIAMIDMRDAFEKDGTLKPLEDMPENLTRVIASIEVHELYEKEGDDKVLKGYVKKIKMNDKIRSIELLGKNLKLFIDTKVVTGKVIHEHKIDPVDINDRVAQIRSRRGPAIDINATATAGKDAQQATVVVNPPEDF